MVRPIPKPPKFIAPGSPLGRALGGAVVGVFFGSNEAPRTPTDGLVLGGVGSFGGFTSAGFVVVGLFKNEFAMPIFISSNILFGAAGGGVGATGGVGAAGGAGGFGVDKIEDLFGAKRCDDIKFGVVFVVVLGGAG